MAVLEMTCSCLEDQEATNELRLSSLDAWVTLEYSQDARRSNEAETLFFGNRLSRISLRPMLHTRPAGFV